MDQLPRPRGRTHPLVTGPTGVMFDLLLARLPKRPGSTFADRAAQPAGPLPAAPPAPGSKAMAAQIMTKTNTDPKAPLGGLSEAYESGGRGPGLVSTGRGDHGGVSYGTYQLSSRLARPEEFLASEGHPWADRFGTMGSEERQFAAAWREVAATDAEAFRRAQHDFIQRTHYQVQADRIASKARLDISSRSQALKNVVWSTAVQHGPGTDIIINTIKRLASEDPQSLGDEALIRAIYAERGRKNPDGSLARFGSSSPEVQAGVSRRYQNELDDALAMLEREQTIRGARR